MKQYTLGFIFDASLEKVLLIHKNRPEWQAGKVNGLGGKVEEGEDSLTCIVREIQEEANLQTQKDDWIYLGRLGNKDWNMEVFALVYKGDITGAKTMTDEQVEWFEVNNLPSNVMQNLCWLIPLALDKIQNGDFNSITVEYGYKS